MSEPKNAIVTITIAGVLYTVCPVTEERQPHPPHQDHSPLHMPLANTWIASGQSSIAGPVLFSNSVDSADVVIAADRARRNAWQRMIANSTSVTPLPLLNSLKEHDE